MQTHRLTLFAAAERGHAVLDALLAYPGLVEALVIAESDEWFARLGARGRDAGVRVRERREKTAIGTRFALAVGWRWMIDAGGCRLIVLHDSLLPRYRGFNPLVTALVNGDTEIGASAFYATAAYDRGELIAQSASRIAYPMKVSQAIKIVARNCQDLAKRIGADLAAGREPPAAPQDEAQASYSLWRDAEDYRIDWGRPAAELERFVDAVGEPYAGAAARLEERTVRIREARALPDVRIANRAPGKVIFVEGGKPVVVCGQGLLRVDELVDDATGASLLPLKRLRLRFKS